MVKVCILMSAVLGVVGAVTRLELVSVTIRNRRLRRFGHVKRKDDNDWVKRCITWEVEGIRQRGCPKKIRWNF